MFRKTALFFREIFSVTEKTNDVKLRYKALLFLITTAVLYFSLSVAPGGISHKHFMICIFHNITGYPCPACGTVRGLKLFFHLRFFEALMINPLSVIVAVIMIISFFWILIDVVRGKQTFYDKVYFLETPWYVIVICLILTALNEYWNIVKGL